MSGMMIFLAPTTMLSADAILIMEILLPQWVRLSLPRVSVHMAQREASSSQPWLGPPSLFLSKLGISGDLRGAGDVTTRTLSPGSLHWPLETLITLEI